MTFSPRANQLLFIVQSGPAYLPAAPYEQTTDGRKDEANDQECRQHGLRCQYRLPCLESLLLERSI